MFDTGNMHDGVVWAIADVLDLKGCKCTIAGGIMMIVKGAIVVMKGKLVAKLYWLIGMQF